MNEWLEGLEKPRPGNEVSVLIQIEKERKTNASTKN